MIPNDIEKQRELALKVQKLAIQEIVKSSFAEQAKDIKKDIKDIAGKDFDVKSAVDAIVDKLKLKQAAQEAQRKAEEGEATASILSKYFVGNLYDIADNYAV